MNKNSLKIVKSLVLTLLVVFILASCSGRRDKIEGQWERYNTSLTNFVIDTMVQEMWDFDNGTLTIYKREMLPNMNNATLKNIATLKYRVGRSKGRTAIFIEEDNNHPLVAGQKEQYVGENRIYKLKDDVMAMKGVDTYIYYEFYR